MLQTMTSPQRDPFLSRAPWILLAALSLAAALTRLWTALHAPWYWDEGYVAQVAMDLGRSQRPSIGALWANGLLPLTASWLAPFSAAPFAALFPSDPILGVRIWAALLGGLACAAIGLIGRRLAGWGAGLTAAGIYAFARFPVYLGGLGLYHPLGALFAIAAFGLAVLDDERAVAPAWLPWIPAGLAALACYWLWWVPLGLVLRGTREGARVRLAHGLIGFAPAAVAIGLGLASPGGLAMFSRLSGYHHAFNATVLWTALRSYPGAWAGTAGLFLLPKRHRWMAFAAALGLADLLRQRGDLIGTPYVLLPLLPWACLGLGLLVARASSQGWVWWAPAFVAAFWAGAQGSTAWMSRLSSQPAMARNLRNFVQTHPMGNWNVIATPVIGALLRPLCRSSEISQSASYGGAGTTFLPEGLTHAAYSHDASLSATAFVVVGRPEFDSLFHIPANALLMLKAEKAQWPLVFENPEFRVFGNPVFVGRKDPSAYALLEPHFYAIAAGEADRVGDRALGAFGRARALSTPLTTVRFGPAEP